MEDYCFHNTYLTLCIIIIIIIIIISMVVV